MKKRILLALVLVVAISGVASAWTSMVYVDDFKAGNAINECAQAGTYQYSLKVDDWDYIDENGTWNGITIYGSDGKTFNWSASHGIGAVIVKGGPGANIFYYNPQATGDTGLYAPDRKDVSHATFCWNPEVVCKYETAWAKGTRYVQKGNWAMYVPYSGTAKTVDLMAGQSYVAGTVSFSAPADGYVTITINLTGGWSLQSVSEPVKIQGYNTAPSGNPSPGLFTTYKGANTTVMVPAYNFYGVHLDVMICE